MAVSRSYDASPAPLRDAIRNVEPFMLASGFDHVSVDDSTIVVANRVGPVEIELTLRLVEDDDVALAFEQIGGIFETMRTRYSVMEDDSGSEVTAVTEFALDLDFVGDFLDATVIRRQRRRELNAQFDYLADRVEPSSAGTCSGS